MIYKGNIKSVNIRVLNVVWSTVSRADTMESVPLTITDADEDVRKEIENIYIEQLGGPVYIGPTNYIAFRSSYLETFLRDLSNLKARDSDVIVMTVPRSGTTMTQELVWLINNDLDYETATSKLLDGRYQLICFPDTRKVEKELCSVAENFVKYRSMPMHGIEEMSERRFMKTHLPLSLFPAGTLDSARVVYVARDPRDACVSQYFFRRLKGTTKPDVSLHTLWKHFKRGIGYNTSDYFEHVREAWSARHHPNMMFLFYEDIVMNLPAAIKKLCNFFNKSYSESQIQELCEHMAFKNFQKIPSVNRQYLIDMGVFKQSEPDDNKFIRKGKVGGWRDHFTEEMAQEAEQWISDNLRDTDLKYPQY